MSTITGVVRFTVPGFHRWPGATGKRMYLALRHRHQFHVEVSVPLTHNEREIEFHDLLDFCKGAFSGGEMGEASCETMAGNLGKEVARQFSRRATVSIFEDGEVGAIVVTEP